MKPDVTEVIATTLRVPAERLANGADMFSVPEWDSLAHVELMTTIEEVYGLEVDQDQILELTSVQAIREFVASRTGGA